MYVTLLNHFIWALKVNWQNRALILDDLKYQKSFILKSKTDVSQAYQLWIWIVKIQHLQTVPHHVSHYTKRATSWLLCQDLIVLLNIFLEFPCLTENYLYHPYYYKLLKYVSNWTFFLNRARIHTQLLLRSWHSNL